MSHVFKEFGYLDFLSPQSFPGEEYFCRHCSVKMSDVSDRRICTNCETYIPVCPRKGCDLRLVTSWDGWCVHCYKTLAVKCANCTEMTARLSGICSRCQYKKPYQCLCCKVYKETPGCCKVCESVFLKKKEKTYKDKKQK
jgi:hypothetical protein